VRETVRGFTVAAPVDPRSDVRLHRAGDRCIEYGQVESRRGSEREKLKFLVDTGGVKFM
jgi:hypothetical protein